MKIDLLCPSGSPLGIVPPDLWGRGLGGSENALVSLMETFAARGHDVTVFNEPRDVGDFSGVKYRPHSYYNHADERDVMIYFRTPHHTMTGARGLKVFWSCDQYTAGNYETDVFPFMHKIVCISPLHVDYFKRNYRIDDHSKLHYIDLGVRVNEYGGNVERIPHRAIFCSVPDRGLQVLNPLWSRIVEQVPDASLVISSDYTLWNSPDPGNYSHRLNWLSSPNVQFLGNVPRRDLIVLQQQAEVLLYPNIYEELFCVSLAECQVAGAIPVVSEIGALKTTFMYGHQIDGNPTTPDFSERFIAAAIYAFNNPSCREEGMKASRERFDWDKIAASWESKIFQ